MTTKPRQHDLCQNERSGSSSDNIVTWDIRRQRSWLVHYDTQEQDGKLYGLFIKSYVVQRAKYHAGQNDYRPAFLIST